MLPRVLFGIVLLFGAAADVGASEDAPWAWVKAANVTNSWDVSTGTASVTIAGTNFRASLYSADGSRSPSITLSGTVRNGRLIVKETVLGSDYSGSRYAGTLESKRWGSAAHPSGVDVITLTDRFGMIGLTRAIGK